MLETMSESEKALARERARKDWFSLVYPIAFAMHAGQSGASYYLSGDQTRGILQTHIALGEIAAAWSTALDLQGGDQDWALVCEALTDVCQLHLHVLEQQLDDIRRHAPPKSEPSEEDLEVLDRIGRGYADAMFAAQLLYHQLSGDPDELADFASLYARMQTERVSRDP